MRLAVRFSENDIKDLIIDAMKKKHRIYLTKYDISFFRGYDSIARNPEQFMVQIDLTRFNTVVQQGQQIFLNGEAK